MMNITISGISEKPIYQQVIDQLSAQIIQGELNPGTMLRTVAKELRISVITIKKAWEELERLGFIYTMVGRGCFVADSQKRKLLIRKVRCFRKNLKKIWDIINPWGLHSRK